MILSSSLTRRDFLSASSSLLAAGVLGKAAAQPAADSVKTVAAVVTEFRHNSHAEVITARWMEGFNLDGSGGKPRSKLVAMYTDQVPTADMSRRLSEKHQVPIYGSIRECLCRGGNKLAVDGVQLIGEHGKYPFNEKGQHEYPRRRFFEETMKVFRDSGRVVPVFTDKHLSFSWENAKWMADQVRELKVPLMAGSSLPNTWRFPAFDLEEGTEIEEALAVGYSSTEAYGFHALETLQCQVERRKGGETGVVAVTCLEGPDVWKAGEQKRWSRALVEAATGSAKKLAPKGDLETRCKKPVAFMLEYKDGLRATVLMLTGYTHDFHFAARVKGKAEPVGTTFWLQPDRPHSHFTYLVREIDEMILAGKPSRPVERTLLTTGVLDAVMTSRFQGFKRLETPQLAVAYSPGPAWKQPPAPEKGPPLPET